MTPVKALSKKKEPNLYSYGLYSYGPYSYGLYSYGKKKAPNRMKATKKLWPI